MAAPTAASAAVTAAAASQFLKVSSGKLPRTKIGVVVAADRISKTITVQVRKLEWNDHVRKHLRHHERFLVHDELQACIPGDVVEIQPGLRMSQHKRHVVTSIMSPFHTGKERIQPEALEEFFTREAQKREHKMLTKLTNNPEKYQLKYEEVIRKGKDQVSDKVKELVLKNKQERIEKLKREKEEKARKAKEDAELAAERAKKREENENLRLQGLPVVKVQEEGEKSLENKSEGGGGDIRKSENLPLI